MEKFPDIDTSLAAAADSPRCASSVTSPIRQSAYANGSAAHPLGLEDRWRPAAVRHENGGAASTLVSAGRTSFAAVGRSSPLLGAGGPGPGPGGGGGGGGTGRARQKSISEAFRNVRTRHGSVSQNAQEIAEALRAPVSPKLIILCVMWYTSSALTNTSSKMILNALDRPATLTLVQFALVSSYCLLSAWLATAFPLLRGAVPALRYPIRPPTRQVLATTLPLAGFQIAGHLLSSTATSKIPVSLVHTIKGLSPLFTVLAYRLVYDIRYPTATYLSLIPLTCGVMLACSGNARFGGELLGVVYAFLAALIFVSQNIFSKKLFNDAARAEAEGAGAQSRRLDKLNLLCYSSGLAFVVTMPIWFWSEGASMVHDVWRDGAVALDRTSAGAFDHGRLALEFLFNGTFHFGQNILAFVLLSMVSPVTYSVASLIKRVFVIVMAIIWFRNPTTGAQAAGIALTFVGLYLYDRTSERSDKADRRVRMLSESSSSGRQRVPAPLLPLSSVVHGSAEKAGHYADTFFASPVAVVGDDKKREDDGGGGGGGGGGGSSSAAVAWLPRGTRQEDTWLAGDVQRGTAVGFGV